MRSAAQLLPLLLSRQPRLIGLAPLAARPALREFPALSRALRTVAKEKSLASLAPEVAAQWHPTKNGDLTTADVTSKSGAKRWWEASPDSRVGQGTGCPCCSGHQVSVTNSLASLAPTVAAQWHPTKNGDLTPADVTSKSGTKCWWLCDLGPDRKWEASPDHRVGLGTGCPCCDGHKVSVTNSLASLAPEVAAQWHPTGNGDLTPADITSQSNTKRWWLCVADPAHEWEASPNRRVGGSQTGCPQCRGRVVR
jgi:hypothetical protein